MRFKLLYLTALSLMLASCVARKRLPTRTEIAEMSARKVLKYHHKNRFDEKTLETDATLNIPLKGRSQSVSVKLRSQKGKTLWLSGSFFGMTFFKALLTPKKISYYNKLNKTFYEGDFSVFRKLIGTEISFEMLENLLLGDLVLPLKSADFDAAVDQKSYLLSPKNESPPIQLWLHPFHFKIEKQTLSNPQKKQRLAIAYKKFKALGKTTLPTQIEIVAQGSEKETKIGIEYRNIRLNKSLSFPYKVPKGYQKTSP